MELECKKAFVAMRCEVENQYPTTSVNPEAARLILCGN